MVPGNAYRLNTGRAAGVIKLAAEKSGWGKPMPAGRALGIAFYFSHGGHFAEVADVSVDANKVITVHRVTVVGDVGPIVNRSMAENQCEGAVIDGLSTMLGLKVTFEDGRAQQQQLRRVSDPADAAHAAGRRVFRRQRQRADGSRRTRVTAARRGRLQRDLRGERSAAAHAADFGRRLFDRLRLADDWTRSRCRTARAGGRSASGPSGRALRAFRGSP